MRKLIGLSFLLSLILSACANGPAPKQTVAPLTVGTTDPVILTAPPFIQATATEKFIPKSNDLIFVEFFAVT